MHPLKKNSMENDQGILGNIFFVYFSIIQNSIFILNINIYFPKCVQVILVSSKTPQTVLLVLNFTPIVKQSPLIDLGWPLYRKSFLILVFRPFQKYSKKESIVFS